MDSEKRVLSQKIRMAEKDLRDKLSWRIVQKDEAAIEKSQQDLTVLRLKALDILLEDNFFGKVFLSVKVVGTSLVLVDAASRVYVWHALDANTTLIFWFIEN